MNGKSTAYGIVLTQLGMAFVAGLAAWFWSGRSAGAAALAGGLINAVASLTVAILVFRGGVRPAGEIAKSFYVAEAVKILLTAVLLLLALTVFGLAFLPLAAGFALTLLAYWLALLPAGPIQRWIKA